MEAPRPSPQLGVPCFAPLRFRKRWVVLETIQLAVDHLLDRALGGLWLLALTADGGPGSFTRRGSGLLGGNCFRSEKDQNRGRQDDRFHSGHPTLLKGLIWTVAASQWSSIAMRESPNLVAKGPSAR